MKKLLKTLTDGIAIRGSEHVQQDVWGRENSTLWVIDGATRASTEENMTVAAWVTKLSAKIAQLARDSPSLSLQELLKQAIVEARSTTTGWHPSATISLARLHPTAIELLVLGDAGALVRTELGDHAGIQDNRLQNVGAQIRAKRQLARQQGNITEAKKLTQELLSEEDRWRNKENGFWVVGADPKAAEEAVHHRFENARGIVLMSDGVYGEIGKFLGNRETAWEALTSNLEECLLQLRHQRLEESGAVDDMSAAVGG
ncbi:hypothetical protein [Micrococcoides hystricis]|uniref:PPM-type phosphatase domain-containing protein n=1 Tax=Micrococcoides hystricis TaxID=1572761 RepID=A0ABV6PCZ1_9MICC